MDEIDTLVISLRSVFEKKGIFGHNRGFRIHRYEGVRWVKLTAEWKQYKTALYFIDKKTGDIYGVRSWSQHGPRMGNVKDNDSMIKLVSKLTKDDERSRV